MNIAALILVMIQVIGLGYEIAKHGEAKKERNYNAWVRLFAIVVLFTLYYYAGIFKSFNL